MKRSLAFLNLLAILVSAFAMKEYYEQVNEKEPGLPPYKPHGRDIAAAIIQALHTGQLFKLQKMFVTMLKWPHLSYIVAYQIPGVHNENSQLNIEEKDINMLVIILQQAMVVGRANAQKVTLSVEVSKMTAGGLNVYWYNGRLFVVLYFYEIQSLEFRESYNELKGVLPKFPEYNDEAHTKVAEYTARKVVRNGINTLNNIEYTPGIGFYISVVVENPDESLALKAALEKLKQLFSSEELQDAKHENYDNRETTKIKVSDIVNNAASGALHFLELSPGEKKYIAACFFAIPTN